MVPVETVQEMKEAGLFRVLQPKRFGGYELDPRVFYRVQMALAEGCMSTAWIYGVIGVHNWQLPLFPEQAQQDVWAKDTGVLIDNNSESPNAGFVVTDVPASNGIIHAIDAVVLPFAP